MSNNVAITIKVIDNDSGEKLDFIKGKLEELGPAGEAAGAQASAGLDQVGEHAISSREQVRLLSEEMGVRVPRAMQSVIANSQMLSSAISAIGPALIGIGAVDIFAHLAESAYNFYEKYLDVNAAIDAYIEKAATAARTELFDKGSLEMQIQMVRDLNTQVTDLQQKKALSPNFAQTAFSGDEYSLTANMPPQNPLFTTKDSAALAAAMEQQDKHAEAEAVRIHQQNDENIRNRQTVALAGAGPAGKPGVEMSYANELGAEETRFVKDLDAILVGIANRGKQPGDVGYETMPADAGQAQGAQIIDAARAKQTADNIALHRQENEALAALDEKALESQLSGIALLEAQRVWAEREWMTAHRASARAIADIDTEFNAKEEKLFEEQAAARLKAAQGMGGAAAGAIKMPSADDMMQRMEKAHETAMEQVAKEEELAARQSLAPWQQAQLRIVDDYQDRVRRIQDLESQQDAALQADMAAHKANFAADQQAEIMVARDTDAQMLAARKTMNAQMQQADEETRDKLAQGLQSVFSHPEQFFEKRAMDTAFQMMANEMLSVFKSSSPAGGIMQYMFGMGPQMSASTNPLTAMESALGMGGHGHAGTSTGSSPGLAQFQQGTMAFSASTATFASAVSRFASLATASGGIGTGGGMSGMGGGGSLLSGLGGAVSTATGAGGGLDLATMAGDVNPMMLPGVGGSTNAGALATFGSSLALPGMAGGGSSSMTSGLLGGAGMGAGAAAAPTGASAMGAAMGFASGGLMAGMGAFSAYQNSNPLAGLMSGAMGGMEMGAAIGSVIPGLGTVVGGAIGAIAGGIGGLLAGVFGDKGRGQAQALDVNQIQPALAKDVQDYEAGRAGYNTEATQLNQMLISAQNATNSMGSGARAYFTSNIQPEINTVLSSFQKQEIGGRSAITLTGGQYHGGGMIGGFGDLATSDTEGFIHAMRDEFVVNPIAAAAHAPILQAMNSGTNFAYSNSAQPRMPASAAGGNGPSITVQALDSKSVAQWAKAGGGLALMAALNQAQRQYSGVGRG